MYRKTFWLPSYTPLFYLNYIKLTYNSFLVYFLNKLLEKQESKNSKKYI